VPTDNVFSICNSNSEELKARAIPNMAFEAQREKQQHGSTCDLPWHNVGWVVNTCFIPRNRPSNYCKLQQYTVAYSVTYLDWET